MILLIKQIKFLDKIKIIKKNKKNKIKQKILKRKHYTSKELYFINNNKYIYNIENNIVFKYSGNKFNYSKRNNRILSVSLNCYDTYCYGRMLLLTILIIKILKNL